MLKNGVDSIDKYADALRGKRLGLITTVTGLNSDFVSTIDILHKNFNLTAMFSPEHGIRGDKDAGALVETYVDPYTGVTVYSLYADKSRRLTAAMLDEIDALVYDIQDVGARYYTYLYTMLYAMEDCAKAGKEIIILDRANPLGGTVVEGNVLKQEFKSFVGGYPLAMRYGLTIGEFAVMANEQQKIGARLTVVPVRGWSRDAIHPCTGRCWIPPSLGLPKFESALLYPGMCLFEGTNISEGRGTTSPFEVIGAPFIKAQELSHEMNSKCLKGVKFTPAYYTPTFSKWQGEKCEGIRVNITDYDAVSPVEVGITLLYTMLDTYEQAQLLPSRKENEPSFFEKLCGSDIISRRRPPLRELLEQFDSESREFSKIKQEYHLYK